MNQLQPIVRLPDQGETVNAMGITVTHKARSAETGGSWALVQYTAPPGFSGPPPHTHEYMTEAFFLLDGKLSFRVGAERITTPARSFVNIPPGIVHTFSNETRKPATFLVFLSPGGFESYFDEIAQLVAEERTWPPADLNRLHAIQARYDMRLAERA